ncbi:hypothetical protein B0H17DRAFT_1182595, partial [Mycena rosella]
ASAALLSAAAKLTIVDRHRVDGRHPHTRVENTPRTNALCAPRFGVAEIRRYTRGRARRGGWYKLLAPGISPKPYQPIALLSLRRFGSHSWSNPTDYAASTGFDQLDSTDHRSAFAVFKLLSAFDCTIGSSTSALAPPQARISRPQDHRRRAFVVCPSRSRGIYGVPRGNRSASPQGFGPRPLFNGRRPA